jgi:hypothetical protein
MLWGVTYKKLGGTQLGSDSVLIHVLLSFSQYDMTRRVGCYRLVPSTPSQHAIGPTHDRHERQYGRHSIDFYLIHKSSCILDGQVKGINKCRHIQGCAEFWLFN